MKKLILIFFWIILSVSVGVYFFYYLPDLVHKTPLSMYNKKIIIDAYNWLSKKAIKINIFKANQDMSKIILYFSSAIAGVYLLFTFNTLLFIFGFKKINLFKKISWIVIFLGAIASMYNCLYANLIVCCGFFVSNFFLVLLCESRVKKVRKRKVVAEEEYKVLNTKVGEEFVPLPTNIPNQPTYSHLSDEQNIMPDVKNSLTELEKVRDEDHFGNPEPDPILEKQPFSSLSGEQYIIKDVKNSLKEIEEMNLNKSESEPVPEEQVKIKDVEDLLKAKEEQNQSSEIQKIIQAEKELKDINNQNIIDNKVITDPKFIDNLIRTVDNIKQNELADNAKNAAIDKMINNHVKGRLDRVEQMKKEYDRIKAIENNNQ